MIYNAFSRYRLLEADDDDTTSGGNEGGGKNVDVSEDNDTNADTGNDENNNDAGDDNAENNDTNDTDNNNDNQDTDYDIDDGGGDDAPAEDGGGDEGGEGGLDDTGDDETGRELQDDDSKKANPEFDNIYDALSPKQKAIKDKELRNNFMIMYQQTSSIIENLVILPKTSATNKQIKKVMESLFTFRKYIAFYVNNLYVTKTLMENTYEYYKYLAIFSSYRDVVKELEKELAHPDTEE